MIDRVVVKGTMAEMARCIHVGSEKNLGHVALGTRLLRHQNHGTPRHRN